ncbi:MAG: GNAT family N-acetyltransferase [Janthinobacterium lividum]
MSEHGWSRGEPPEELGVLAHGPVLLARALDVTAGLRCVFAHRSGLHLPVVYRATGPRRHDAARWSAGHLRRWPGVDDPDRGTRYSAPRLQATLDGRTGPVDTDRVLNRHGVGVWGAEASYWIGDLPHDGRLVLTLAWPDAGLPATTTTLTLHGLDDLGTHVVPLLTWPKAGPLRTARLQLEPLRLDHAEELFAVLDDPRLHEFTGDTPPTRDHLTARVARQVPGRSPDGRTGWLNWTLRHRDDNRVLGTLQATLTRRDVPRHDADDGGLGAELAWVIGHDQQRRGYATEAAGAVVSWLAANGVGHFSAHVHPDHHASAWIHRLWVT